MSNWDTPIDRAGLQGYNRFVWILEDYLKKRIFLCYIEVMRVKRVYELIRLEPIISIGSVFKIQWLIHNGRDQGCLYVKTGRIKNINPNNINSPMI